MDNTDKVAISAITLMELMPGIRNKRELYTLNKFLLVCNIRVYYVNEQINLHAVLRRHIHSRERLP
ncbi:MAG: hypothetical protein JSR33_06180 [Proteobacteria bacterium]|nr:hypothetical protein [Pseudomonadota bacterium]